MKNRKTDWKKYPDKKPKNNQKVLIKNSSLVMTYDKVNEKFIHDRPYFEITNFSEIYWAELIPPKETTNK